MGGIAMNLVDAYLDRSDWRVQENSNMDYSLQGLNTYLSGAAVADHWLTRVYPAPIAEAHRSGDLHIHDLGTLGPYCVGWDLYDFLRRGIAGVRGKITSTPPRHFRTALGQLVNLLYTLQGEAAGAQAVSNLDTLLAPFIRADGLSYADVKQALQEFVFNLNVPTRVGFQAPFTNITLDVTVSPTYKDWPVVIGGEDQDTTYGDYQAEMDLFNRAFCEVMLEGDGQGRGFTFPIPTYNVTRDFPWDSEVGQAIARMTAKYGTPYFANFVSADLNPEDARSMCCRLRLDLRELRKRGGGLFGANPLTGSIGVVTINLPRLGYLSRSREEFFLRLAHLMDLAKESLLVKRRQVEEWTRQGLYPYSAVYLEPVRGASGEYWNNHFNTIGLVGMQEAAMNLLGRGIASEAGHAFAREVLDFMRERLVRYQEETGQLFNLEATPAEGVSYRLARLDKERYPGIVQAGDPEGDPYYTNSTHLPVGYTTDPFEALDHQHDLQTRYTGGTVLHLFLGERVEDPRVIGELVTAITRNYGIPYFTFTPTYSICPRHGYLAGEQWECPSCHAPTEVWSRVVGYYRPVQSWNRGKRQEFSDRRAYAVQMD
ncbi:Ribonucleotide reductase of class III (anaerobic), large subunit [Candidatus Hydrogenisulfobacillus filiaventi]|uniref:Ribonucleotide reductase of class III (Anaerobic), large subunit n=1 Tax=Candidatus Hydrogenisulfobacillus filiaventi TaxID=2707344 RepID=A0A6F8ZIC8_9FIRM|nr:Ribonucleotide reductase of class III (anaerobic), large subunit [Candidatus Hydrogenisulfobacillus filiaventi]